MQEERVAIVADDPGIEFRIMEGVEIKRFEFDRFGEDGQFIFKAFTTAGTEHEVREWPSSASANEPRGE